MVNGLFSGVWADDNFGSSTTVRIQSKAPSYTFTGLAVERPYLVSVDPATLPTGMVETFDLDGLGTSNQATATIGGNAAEGVAEWLALNTQPGT